MANQNDAVCWDSPDRLVVGIALKSPAGETLIENETLARLDTGYYGDVLLPYADYIAFDLQRWQYPKDAWSVGTRASGEELTLIASQAYAVIPRLDQQFEVVVESFEANTNFLLRRTFLRRLRTLLDGPARQVCILKS